MAHPLGPSEERSSASHLDRNLQNHRSSSHPAPRVRAHHQFFARLRSKFTIRAYSIGRPTPNNVRLAPTTNAGLLVRKSQGLSLLQSSSSPSSASASSASSSSQRNPSFQTPSAKDMRLYTPFRRKPSPSLHPVVVVSICPHPSNQNTTDPLQDSPRSPSSQITANDGASLMNRTQLPSSQTQASEQQLPEGSGTQRSNASEDLVTARPVSSSTATTFPPPLLKKVRFSSSPPPVPALSGRTNSSDSRESTSSDDSEESFEPILATVYLTHSRCTYDRSPITVDKVFNRSLDLPARHAHQLIENGSWLEYEFETMNDDQDHQHGLNLFESDDGHMNGIGSIRLLSLGHKGLKRSDQNSLSVPKDYHQNKILTTNSSQLDWPQSSSSFSNDDDDVHNNDLNESAIDSNNRNLSRTRPRSWTSLPEKPDLEIMNSILTNQISCQQSTSSIEQPLTLQQQRSNNLKQSIIDDQEIENKLNNNNNNNWNACFDHNFLSSSNDDDDDFQGDENQINKCVWDYNDLYISCDALDGF